MNKVLTGKMTYKLLAVAKCPQLLGIINIGDYIQALAASQYYPHIDGFLDRDEELKDYDGDQCKMIMNGWYMHNPDNWPPSKHIVPLFVAFHINSVAKDKLLSPQSINYLKSYQPIGCRDINTMNILKQNGVDAYFSGCMTLTLGKNYFSSTKSNKTYIVDPIYNGALTFNNVLKALVEFVKHPFDIFKLYNIKQLHVHYGKNPLYRFLKTALYYKEYVKAFGRKIIMESEYICQEDTYYNEHFKTDMERLKEAERLVSLYSKAQLVITSRIHCALPCLGLQTPVIYIDPVQNTETSSCRLGGLREFFNIIKMDNGSLKPEFPISTPIALDKIPKNKETWKQYAQNLDKRCSEFIENTNF